MKRTISIIPLILLLATAFAQQPDKAKYAASPSGFMQKEIMKDITGKEGDAPNRKSFVMDFDGKSYPTTQQNTQQYGTTSLYRKGLAELAGHTRQPRSSRAKPTARADIR